MKNKWGFIQYILLVLGVFFSISYIDLKMSTMTVYQCLLLVLTYICCLVLHEMGHVLGYALSCVHIESVKIIFFQFFFQNNMKKIIITSHGLSGYVVPRVPTINDSESYARCKHSYLFGCLMGPLVSLLSIIGATSVLLLNHDALRESFEGIIIFTIILFSASLIISGMGDDGDFGMCKTIMRRDLDFAITVYSSNILCEDFERKICESQFLPQYIAGRIEPIIGGYGINEQTQSFVDYELMLFLANYKKTINEKVIENLVMVNQNIQLFYENKNDNTYIFVCHYVYYLIKTNQIEAAIIIFENLQIRSEWCDSRLKLYYIRQYEHILQTSDNSKLLYDERNIYPFRGIENYKQFLNYYIIEKRITATRESQYAALVLP